jgi:hypothetical protein
VNLSAELAVEAVPPTVTVTSTAPALPTGLVAVQLVTELQVTAVPAAVPKLTVVPVVAKFVPVMVTTVPPARGPEVGLIPVTVGAVTADAGPTRRPRTMAPRSKKPPTIWAPGKVALGKDVTNCFAVRFLALLCTLLPIRTVSPTLLLGPRDRRAEI